MIPKDFFSNKNIDKRVSKIFAALDLEKPDMIFKVPQSNTIMEYFIHDSPYSIPHSFEWVYNHILKRRIQNLPDGDRKRIKLEIKKLVEINKSISKIKWTHKTNLIIKDIYPPRLHMNDKFDMTSQGAIPFEEDCPDNTTNRLLLLKKISSVPILGNKFKRPQLSNNNQLPNLVHNYQGTEMKSNSQIPSKNASRISDLPLVFDSYGYCNDYFEQKNSDETHDADINENSDTIQPSNGTNEPSTGDYATPMMSDDELIYRINRLEHHRKLVEERLKTIILGLTDACQQANAYIWMQPHTQDRLGSFVSKYSISNTTIIADTLINKNRIIHDSALHTGFKNKHQPCLEHFFKTFADSSRHTIIPTSRYHCTESFYRMLIDSSQPYDSEGSMDKLKIIEYDMNIAIETIERTCKRIAASMSKTWKNKVINKGPRWKRCIDGTKQWLLHRNDDGDEIHALNVFQFLKPGLTHMIYWHDKNDASIWKKYIQEQFPLGLFLIGCKTKGYMDATVCMRKNQPLFVFDETGGSASIVSHMIRFMKEDNYVRPKASKAMMYPDASKRFTSSKKYHYLNSERFIEIQNWSRVMLQNWPDPFNPNSVLVIDTLTDSIENLQNNITKTMNAVFEDIPELGGRKEDEVRLAYAWTKYAMLKRNAEKLQLRANVYIIMLASLTVMTTVVSTMVGFIDHWVLHLASVALPILTGIVITFMYTFKPINKWAICESGARMIQSEIYKFRTKSGIYRVIRKHGKQSDVKRARRLFAEELIKVWQSLELSEMKLGSLNTRKEFNETPIYMLPIIKTIQEEEMAALQQYNSQNYYVYHDIGDDDDEPISANIAVNNTSTLKTYNKRHIKTIRTINQQRSSKSIQYSNAMTMNENKNNHVINVEEATMFNTVDKINPCEKMSVETYVKTRLNLILYRHKKRSPYLERIVYVMQTIVFIITASAAFVSHIGYAQWVPVIMSVATMITSIMEQKQLILRLTSTNSVYMQLEQLMCFWQGLSIIERRKHSNATYVVETAEAAVMNELASYIQAVKSVVKEEQE